MSESILFPKYYLVISYSRYQTSIRHEWNWAFHQRIWSFRHRYNNILLWILKIVRSSWPFYNIHIDVSCKTFRSFLNSVASDKQTWVSFPRYCALQNRSIFVFNCKCKIFVIYLDFVLNIEFIIEKNQFSKLCGNKQIFLVRTPFSF